MDTENGSFVQKVKAVVEKIKGVKNIKMIVVIAICVLAILIYFLATTVKSEKKETSETDSSLELESILSQIKGAGKTKVMISYDGEGSIVPAETINSSSTITSKDGNVTEKTTENKNTVIVTSGGSSGPVVLEKKAPDIIGIIVVSEGAGNPEVAVKLIRAVQTITGVTADKITVFEMK